MANLGRGFPRAIRVKAEITELATIRGFVEEAAHDAALEEERVFDLKVAVSEACANVVEHAVQKAPILDVDARLSGTKLTFIIEDHGVFQTPSPAQQVAQNRGLGLPLMVALMDEVCFVRTPDGGTAVSLSVRLRERGAAGYAAAP